MLSTGCQQFAADRGVAALSIKRGDLNTIFDRGVEKLWVSLRVAGLNKSSYYLTKTFNT